MFSPVTAPQTSLHLCYLRGFPDRMICLSSDPPLPLGALTPPWGPATHVQPLRQEARHTRLGWFPLRFPACPMCAVEAKALQLFHCAHVLVTKACRRQNSHGL